MRVVFLELGESNEIQVVAGLLPAFAPAYPFLPQTKFDVLPCRKPGKEPKLLKEKDTVGTGFFHFAAVDPDLSGRGAIESSDEMKQCGLAASRSEEHTSELQSL